MPELTNLKKAVNNSIKWKYPRYKMHFLILLVLNTHGFDINTGFMFTTLQKNIIVI